MNVRSALGAALIGLTLTGAPAGAQVANEDVKCLLASNLFVKNEQDAAKKQVAVFSSYYYLGRIDARLSGTQLSAALKAAAPTITAESAGPTMTACAKRLQGATVAIQALGKSISTTK